MTSAQALESTVAVHGSQIQEVKERQDRTDASVGDLRKDIAALRAWIMGAALASCLGLVGVIAQLIKR